MSFLLKGLSNLRITPKEKPKLETPSKVKNLAKYHFGDLLLVIVCYYLLFIIICYYSDEGFTFLYQHKFSISYLTYLKENISLFRNGSFSCFLTQKSILAKTAQNKRKYTS
jgi:hypothetical protein